MSLASNKRSLWIIQLWPYQQNRTYSQPLPLLPTYSQLHLLLWLPWALDCQLHNESMRENEAMQKYVTRVLLPRNSTNHIGNIFFSNWFISQHSALVVLMQTVPEIKFAILKLRCHSRAYASFMMTSQRFLVWFTVFKINMIHYVFHSTVHHPNYDKFN